MVEDKYEEKDTPYSFPKSMKRAAEHKIEMGERYSLAKRYDQGAGVGPRYSTKSLTLRGMGSGRHEPYRPNEGVSVIHIDENYTGSAARYPGYQRALKPWRRAKAKQTGMYDPDPDSAKTYQGLR